MRFIRLRFQSVLCSSNTLFMKYISTSESFQASSKRLLSGPPWRILFFGTDNFSLKSLKLLCAKLRTGTLISSLGVVSKEKSVIKQFGRSEHLTSYNWPLDDDIKGKYDIGIVVSFGYLISENVINQLPLGCLNVHASLLPRWRGAAPVVHAILNGDAETGVTVMKILPHRYDIGEIVRQYRVPISFSETTTDVEGRLGDYGAQLLMECVRDLPKCVQMAIPQPTIGITYAPKIHPGMAVVNWQNMTAFNIYNLHRALSHVYPLKTNWHGHIVKLQGIQLGERRLNPVNTPSDLQPSKSALQFLNSDLNCNRVDQNVIQSASCNISGHIEFNKRNKILKVYCFDNSYVIVDKLIISGKPMTVLDFYNGFLSKKDKCEWRFA